MKGFVNTLYGMIKKIKDFIGSTDISGISPTMTGAISKINSDLSDNKLYQIIVHAPSDINVPAFSSALITVSIPNTRRPLAISGTYNSGVAWLFAMETYDENSNTLRLAVFNPTSSTVTLFSTYDICLLATVK